MNRSSFALFVALLIHLLLLLLFLMLGSFISNSDIKPKKENKIKISLKEMPKKYKKSGESKKKPIHPKIAPPMPKGSQLTHLTKTPIKTPIKYEPKQEIKKSVLNKTEEPTKQKPKVEYKTKPISQKPYISLVNENNTTKEKEKSALYSMLLEDKSAQEKKIEIKQVKSSSVNQDIKKLYGSKFGKLSTGQQKYILDNQEIMRRITQEVLTRVAGVNLSKNLNVNKNNVIEFYLHPNGDMSDFKFLKKTGYFVLDNTTRETIEYAYSRYPRPSEKTLIRYNVFYNLAGY